MLGPAHHSASYTITQATTIQAARWIIKLLTHMFVVQAQHSPVSPDAAGSSAAEAPMPVSASEINPHPQPLMLEERVTMGGSTTKELQGTKV